VSLRPCEVVLAQLRWDARLDASAVVVVHEGRDGALLEARLPIFLGKGIPTHRVRALRVGALTIWDRAARVDLLASDPDAVIAAAGAPSSTGTAPARGLRVATWNVLGEGARDDRHAPSQEERAAALVDAILALDADVVALEEVEPSLVVALAARAEVTARWALVGADAVEIIGGLLLLAPHGATEVAAPRVSGRRRALLARLPSGETIVAVHLASDHRGDRAAVRREQLASLLPLVDAAPGPVVFAGDFNEEGPGVIAALAARGFVDAWPAVQGDEGGVTFDPVENPIARAISRTGRRQRIDRVLARGATVTSARVVAPTGAPLSDHSAVVVTLTATVAPRFTPSHDGACAIVPPRAAWPVIDAIRARLDPAFGRWPPHVNLVYPLIPPAQLAAAERALAIALADVAPFTLRLDGLGRFAHRGDRVTVWLAPRADGDALAALQRAVEAAVPLPRARAVTHHLTVAACRRDEATALERAGAPSIAPFPVGEVTLFARHAGRMHARATVPLGGGVGLAAALAETGLLAGDERAAAVARACALVDEAAREAGGGALTPIGSEALGVALAGSDVDLVWEAGALEALAEALARRGLRARVVDGAFSRVLRVVIDALPIDVLVADEGARIACADLAALRARLQPAHLVALRAVRVWAARRALVGAAACMPSSLAWAVLVADACAAIPDDTPDEARVAALFRALGAWTPGPVACPTPPERDAARALTPSTTEALREELARAAALAEAPRVPWRALFAAAPVGGGLPTVAALLLDGDDPDAARGRLAGRMRAVVDALAERGLRARPDPRPLTVDGRAAFAVGLATLDGAPVEPDLARPALARANAAAVFLLDE